MSGHGEAPLVAVIATGGTIASRRGADGASTPSLSGEDLLALVPQINARLKPVDLMAKDSSSLTLADMQRISDAVGVELNDPAVTGVVVLHGTDAMEESSLLVHLQHAITKPVVFTGAQFTADHPNADGPSNLAAAIETALDQTNAERGVLLSFGGRCLPAWGLYKLSADAADAFRSARPAAHAAALELAVPLADLRVDIVAIYPGCDAAHIEASLQAGADGVVLAALGSGNANPGIAVAVKRCAERGVPVVVSSRVPEGLLVASYGGGGGGHDLVAAGAIHSSTLRPGQARILLAALIAANSPAEKIVSAFKDGSLS
ncbi:putative L-asparaginase [Agrobacterium fabacearum CFBP 5771]|uniref:L-asparaginase n=1 Tax=Agrobacterium tumefaciens TaxID=358 RepID=A0AB36EIY3_AGRTU|nr:MULTISPECIES: asparaginase [Rhizobium/Agrobacterium group]NTZ62220.1 asparaginase [Agrobacterium tumefaciens]KQY45451.1 L-asparaginase [Rhizobium sp. Root491]OCJ37986.1 L-asparaginase [Agrobacterium tumefaciens]UXR93797.1 asparaginase [Agrobacterium tumefaciens]CVI22438.1 putative L-asparaginase [Agrobacterium fabacearum CFBP 5771]